MTDGEGAPEVLTLAGIFALFATCIAGAVGAGWWTVGATFFGSALVGLFGAAKLYHYAKGPDGNG